MEPIQVSELNHAVLYVRDVSVAQAFYSDVLGFTVVSADPGGRASFLRAGRSSNHHDLGLISVGPGAPRPPRGATGLYHLAWRVDSIEELARARGILVDHGALVGQSDHGVSKSLYAADPDGNEFEIMYLLPAAEWGPDAESGKVAPLDLDAELLRVADDRG
ncbi:VOC family protein [Actinospongicola halichondriae]|uniref:VOC family protein n=1 Tax=Actinospongicola halichondriae TaxID=3236844 RepID=UPI003D37D1B2